MSEPAKNPRSRPNFRMIDRMRERRKDAEFRLARAEWQAARLKACSDHYHGLVR